MAKRPRADLTATEEVLCNRLSEAAARFRHIHGRREGTQGKLALAIGVSKPHLSDMISGHRTVPVRTLDAIARVVRIPAPLFLDLRPIPIDAPVDINQPPESAIDLSWHGGTRSSSPDEEGVRHDVTTTRLLTIPDVRDGLKSILETAGRLYNEAIEAEKQSRTPPRPVPSATSGGKRPRRKSAS